MPKVSIRWAERPCPADWLGREPDSAAAPCSARRGVRADQGAPTKGRGRCRSRRRCSAQGVRWAPMVPAPTPARPAPAGPRGRAVSQRGLQTLARGPVGPLPGKPSGFDSRRQEPRQSPGTRRQPGCGAMSLQLRRGGAVLPAVPHEWQGRPRGSRVGGGTTLARRPSPSWARGRRPLSSVELVGRSWLLARRARRLGTEATIPDRYAEKGKPYEVECSESLAGRSGSGCLRSGSRPTARTASSRPCTRSRGFRILPAAAGRGPEWR